MHLYISRLEWVGDLDIEYHWRAPGGDSFGMIDMRSLPQCARAGGTPEGFAIVAYDGPRSYPWLLVDLGDDLEGGLRPAARDGIERFGGVRLAATTPVGIIRELCLQGDPAGQTRWKPLRISRRHGCRAILGKQWLFQERFSPSHPAWTNTVAVFRADYRRNRARLDYLSGAEHERGLNALRRWTGSTMQKLWGRMGDDLLPGVLPPEYVGDGWRTPATVIGDTFTDSDGVALVDHVPTPTNWGSWVQAAGSITTASNQAKSTAGEGVGRAALGLSSDAMYAELISVSGTAPAVLYRFDPASTNTYYMWRHDAGATGVNELYKRVTGSWTKLWNDAQSETQPVLLRGEVTADDLHSGYIGGVLRMDGFSDNSLTGYLQTGMRLPATNAIGDDFEAGDLGVVATRLRALRGVGA